MTNDTDNNQAQLTTIKNEATAEYVEKKSLFIGYAKPVSTKEDAVQFVKEIKTKHHDARHNVWAYLLNGSNIARYSDDGEPQGSAGVPVLECIKKAGVTNACLVVTRYFGGVLLGIGGLIRAYTKTAAASIEAAGIVSYEAYSELLHECAYPEHQRIMYELAGYEAIIDDVKYSETIKIRFAVKKSLTQVACDKLRDICAGRSTPEIVGTRYDHR